MSKEQHEAQEMIARIKPILAGHDPAEQSIALADLLATWVVGHHPHLRCAVFAVHCELVNELVKYNEHEVFGDAGHPGWADVK